MNPRFYTIGMAGHIDHGKTTLTKALTNINTDRLKEEIERKISIELGYASFLLGEYETTIVDVPGHEKFIRQMIAGVAGIDLVILVIAADEGVMPQTKEHLEILSFLGIEHGIIAVTKSDRVEPDFMELIEDDIQTAVKDTIFEHADVVFVDSVTGTGLEELKLTIARNLSNIRQRDAQGEFRLPIDQVFTLQGQGTIVRGTIYEGTVKKGDSLLLLPQHVPVRVRQMQVHNRERESAIAGQRVAINLGGVMKEEVKRGHVLVSSEHVPLSRTIDVSLQTVRDLKYPVKQRAPVKFHSGTAEVMGKIVLFDRKELNGGEEVLCQIRLDEPVVVKRGDRFVVRRPSPVETIGGGWVIDPLSEKLRFGEETIRKLERKRQGSPEDRLIDALNEKQLLSRNEMRQTASLDTIALEDMLSRLLEHRQVVAVDADAFTSPAVYDKVRREVYRKLEQYHESYPMRSGMNKAEVIQAQQGTPALLIETVIEREIEDGGLKRDKQYISLATFEPHFPPQWKQPLEQALNRLEADGLGAAPLEEYISKENVPKHLYHEIKQHILQKKLAYPLDEKHVIHHRAFDKQLHMLYQGTNGQAFSVQEAKAVLNATRKNLVLFLELLDQLRFTQRTDQQRKWLRNLLEQE
jgi:selenocysteine-specific elongation factor